MHLVHNERTKLTATWINTLATALVAAGFFAPVAALAYGISPLPIGARAMAAVNVSSVLDAAGFDRILLETVGVGQSELEVAQTADTTAVVLVPESGDAVQAMKAGLMEIADVFVINKSDREGADRAAQAIRSALHLRARTSEWDIPVHMTVASAPKGVDVLVDRFEEHLGWLGTKIGRAHV